MGDTCRICGKICGKDGPGVAFNDWVKDTFTNYDFLHPGNVICDECLFWFDQHSAELQRRLGKDKPQKMQNYSHFIKNGEWFPLSKADKKRMAELLITRPFPELAAIAMSGQKHIAFRARRNVAGQNSGWVQFEEIPIYVVPSELLALLLVIEELYTMFSKEEIGSGTYSYARIMKFGVNRWLELDKSIQLKRGTALFDLALFLAQRSGNGDEI